MKELASSCLQQPRNFKQITSGFIKNIHYSSPPLNEIILKPRELVISRVESDCYMKSYMNEIQMALTRISQYNRLVCAFLYKLFAGLS
jgi:hypothetical protein